MSVRVGLIALASLVWAAPLAAQEPDVPPEILRQQIMQRFLMNYQQQAGLTPDQFRQFQQIATESWRRRQELEQRERELFRSLDGQMRPGVAADADSVSKLLDGILAVQRERVELNAGAQAAFAEFLSPVQRAQFVIMTMRLERQIEDILRRRMEQRRMN